MAFVNTSGFEQKRVGLGELAASVDPHVMLVSGWLGSGLGLTLHDPVRRIGGLLHAVLPDASSDLEKAAARPALFVDAGIQALLNSLLRLGATTNCLQAALAGGAQILDAGPPYDVGQRNWDAALRILARLGISLPPSRARSWHSGRLSMELATGEVRLARSGITKPLVLWRNSTATSTG